MERIVCIETNLLWLMTISPKFPTEYMQSGGYEGQPIVLRKRERKSTWQCSMPNSLPIEKNLAPLNIKDLLTLIHFNRNYVV